MGIIGTKKEVEKHFPDRVKFKNNAYHKLNLARDIGSNRNGPYTYDNNN